MCSWRQRAVDLALKGHDVNGYLTSHSASPADTVFNATFGSDLEKLQIVLFYGAKYKNLDKMREGDVHDNFEFVKGYSVDRYQRNVLLKSRRVRSRSSAARARRCRARRSAASAEGST